MPITAPLAAVSTTTAFAGTTRALHRIFVLIFVPLSVSTSVAALPVTLAVPAAVSGTISVAPIASVLLVAVFSLR
jgi:hypothetical protein